jgi:hypothetical protein
MCEDYQIYCNTKIEQGASGGAVTKMLRWKELSTASSRERTKVLCNNARGEVRGDILDLVWKLRTM